jgi:hypothetical protein
MAWYQARAANGKFALNDMKVRSTNPTCVNTQEQLVPNRLRSRHVSKFERTFFNRSGFMK